MLVHFLKYENNYSEYLGNKIQETMYVWPTSPMEAKNIHGVHELRQPTFSVE